MELSLDIDTRDLLRAVNKAEKEVTREMRVSMKSAMQEIQKQARRKHRFKSRSNQLERSVQQSVSSSGLSGKVYLEKGIARYGEFIHDGFKSWAPDEFLYNSAEKKERKVKEVLEKGIVKALKKAGF